MVNDGLKKLGISWNIYSLMILYIQTNQPTFDFSQDMHMWGEHKKKNN